MCCKLTCGSYKYNISKEKIVMSKEIEIRNELFNKEEVMKFFEEKGIVSVKDKHQIDTYYDNPKDSFFKNPDHVTKWIRIREENGNLSFNYKHWLPEDAEICTYCEEEEYDINSKEEMSVYLKKFGFGTNFVPFIVVDKLRRCFLYKSCEIAIDNVKDLGVYIEIEYKGKSDKIDEVKTLLNETLVEIGAKVGPADYKGYAYNILKRKQA